MVTRRKFLRYAAFGAVGLTTYGFYVEPVMRLTVRNWPLTLNGWPEEMLPTRIVVLADFHVANPWMTVERIAEIVKTTMSLNPGLIVLLGDYMPGVAAMWTSGVPPIAEWTAALEPLRAPLGVYAVLGNHDGEKDVLRDAFARVNIPVLANKAVRVERDGHHFWVAGLEDQIIGAPDLLGTLAQTAEGEPVVLLAHEPDIFRAVAEAQRPVALTLSGHTHGGQVRVPFVGNTADLLGAPYSYGHYEVNGRHLIVSGGLGVTRMPVRFLAPPEITVVDLLRPARTANG